MKSALVRLAVLLLIAVVVVTAWAVWFRAGDQPAVAPPSSRLYAAEQDLITSLALRTEDGSAAFVRKDGVWYFTDDLLLPVNLDRWGGVVLLLSGPGVDRLLPEPETPADFGLDVPTTIRIGLADGSEIGVSLGSKTPDERNYYAQVEGRHGVGSSMPLGATCSGVSSPILRGPTGTTASTPRSSGSSRSRARRAS